MKDQEKMASKPRILDRSENDAKPLEICILQKFKHFWKCHKLKKYSETKL